MKPARGRARLALWILALMAALTISAMLTTIALGAALLYRPLREVRIQDGEQVLRLSTREETVAAALAAAGILLRAGDSSQPPLSAPLANQTEITIQRARQVTLVIDERAQTFITRIQSPLTLLSSAGFALEAQDRLRIDRELVHEEELAAWNSPFTLLEIERALPITIVVDETERRLYSHAATVGEALHAAGIAHYPQDSLAPAASTPLRADLRIEIARARAIEISAGGQQHRAFVLADTVGAALEEASWQLGPLDYTRPELTAVITEGMNIQVVRVREEIVEEREVIPYESLSVADPELELDQRRIVSGQNGERIIRQRVRYEDNEITGREQLEPVTIREKQDEIFYYGTRIVYRTLDTELGPLEYWRVIRMHITSYNPCESSPITSRRTRVRRGVVATHPEVIPYYTRVYVPGYGIGVVEDTGLGLIGSGLANTKRWLDLAYECDNYQRWSWREPHEVYLLTPLPDAFPFILPR